MRFGRQNPRQVEVLEGLRPNDRIITSGYVTFNDADELEFTKPIALNDSQTTTADAGKAQ